MNKKLKLKIVKSGNKQIAVAAAAGIREDRFSKIVNGWIEPKDTEKVNISNVLKCLVSDIFNL